MPRKLPWKPLGQLKREWRKEHQEQSEAVCAIHHLKLPCFHCLCPPSNDNSRKEPA